MNRYLFTVRQQFGKTPSLDCFYKVKIPSGITASEAEMMGTLSPDWCEDEIREDNDTMTAMSLRIRFNSDIFQSVCLVTSEVPLTAEEFDLVLEMKHEDNTLVKFLKDSSIKA